MRIISDVEMLRKFEQISGRQLGLVRTVTDATEPLDIKKFDGLINDLTVDRFALALEHLNSAKDQDLATVRGQKTAISRSYYAMYQACRATVFHYELSDIDDHQKVALHLPEDFPDRELWLETLIHWRDKRNDVDYSPYPDKSFDTEAKNAISNVTDFLNVCKQYLRKRGCRNV